MLHFKNVNLLPVVSARHRLTAFVLKSFAQSRGFIFIDPAELRAAKSWLIKHQRDDGSFPAMGRILNKDLQVRTALVSEAKGKSFACIETRDRDHGQKMLTTSSNHSSSGRAGCAVTERLAAQFPLPQSVMCPWAWQQPPIGA